MTATGVARLDERLDELAKQGRSGLLPALQAVQEVYGYVPEEAAVAVGKKLGVPLADIHGVIEFYSLLYSRPVGKYVLHICTDAPCALRGGEQALEAACEKLHVCPGETAADGSLTVLPSPCLGLCDHAPAALYGQTAIGNLDLDNPETWLAPPDRPIDTQIYAEKRVLTVNCGRGRRTTLGEYMDGGGYTGLRRALGMGPQEVIAEVKAAGLVGRGGAAFPTGIKWGGAANAPGEPKYVVCNADESEPGTFKDRVLLEDDPQRVLEGLMIAGYAIGAQQGYIYVRGEYPAAFQALRAACAEARRAGILGENVLGSEFRFEVELRRGAGAYVCGEETALFESIEGKRGFPRLKPPFPVTYGLFGQPTAINNVETLANVPTILAHGAAEYRRTGTEKSPGTKLFCLSGDVERPGLYEVPFGVNLRHMLELAGGICDGCGMQAVLFGGASGRFATPDQVDVEMTFDGLRRAGLPLGSGVVMVFNDRRDLRAVLHNVARFFAHESCGKCYPCQIGTQRQLEILGRVAAGGALPGDVERLSDVGWTMADASICGLGQTAASAALSAMQLWPELFAPRAVK